MSAPPGLVRCLLAAASGFLLAASMPGPGIWPLAFVALVPWTFATERARSRLGALAVDYVLGVCFLVPTVIWLARITLAAFLPVVVIVPLFFALGGALYRRLRRALPAWAALPPAWTACELARGYCPPGGFPWDFLGHAAAGWLDLAGVASVGGALLVSAVFAFANGAVRDALGRLGTKTAWRPLAAAAAVVAVSAGAGAWLRRDVGPLREGPLFACLQPNIPQDLKDSSTGWRTVLIELLRLSEEAAKHDPDVVAIPETMLPTQVDEGVLGAVRFRGSKSADPADVYREDERATVRGFRDWLGPKPWLLAGVLLLARADSDDDLVRPINAALLYDRLDRRTARYEKRHLVPGAEGLPFLGEGPTAEAVRAWVSGVTGGGMIPDLIPGSGAPIFELTTAGGSTVRFGVAICFDNAYADLFREYARAGADFHVVLSNEGWFPNSFEMDAMVGFSAFRAIETRRAVLRCTNTGISCLVAPDGSLASVLEVGGRRRDVQGVFLARPPMGAARTVYGAVGDAPFAVLAAVTLLGAIAASRRFAPLP